MNKKEKKKKFCWCYGLGIYCRAVMENGPFMIGSIIIYIICSRQQAIIKCPISPGEIVYFTFNIYIYILGKSIPKKIAQPLCEWVELETYCMTQMQAVAGSHLLKLAPGLGQLESGTNLREQKCVKLTTDIKSWPRPNTSSTISTWGGLSQKLGHKGAYKDHSMSTLSRRYLI